MGMHHSTCLIEASGHLGAVSFLLQVLGLTSSGDKNHPLIYPAGPPILFFFISKNHAFYLCSNKLTY